MPPKHPSYIRPACKALFCNEGYEFDDLKEAFPDVGESTFKRWAAEPEQYGRDAGLNWFGIRDKQAAAKYEIATMENAASVVLNDIMDLMHDTEIDAAKRADALSKLMKFHDKLIDPRGRVGALWAFLEDWTKFLKTEFPQLLKGEHGDTLLTAIKVYKNESLKRIVG